jgi:hypothetical protein
MMKKKRILKIAQSIKCIASIIDGDSDNKDLLSGIVEIYGITVEPTSSPECIRSIYWSLSRLNPDIVRKCGIKKLSFQDLGPSRKFYPNHGLYINNTLVLNDRLLNDPSVIIDSDNRVILNKLDQTFYHELGHGWDEYQGDKGDMSLEEDWLSLSGWSKYPKPGLKRIKIREKDCPEIIGEYYYSPHARFTRFYAKRNPWDDWADTFSYYVGGAKSYIPKDKVDYFDKILKKYT